MLRDKQIQAAGGQGDAMEVYNLPRAVRRAFEAYVLNPDYDFGGEQTDYAAYMRFFDIAVPPDSFRQKVISIYSGQDPTCSRYAYAGSDKTNSPLNADGSFKDEGQRLYLARQIQGKNNQGPICSA
ncbi:MAG: hypothetical protein J0L77_02800 [Alphaproteobacteria bacterium]|nr:hypothetical protein [Alphaproteobacteria bacterium]